MKWKCSVTNTAATPAMHAAKRQNVLPHNQFIDRIRKSLYFGNGTLADDMEVSRPLAEYASELFTQTHKGHSLNRLNSAAAGSVHATPCSLIMALIYLDRINITDPNYVRRITPQELFIVSMMISTKFYAGHDEEIYLSDWAEDGNMSDDRLKQLELDFLCAIDWNIYISNEQFFHKLTDVEKELARREGFKRGWLTYTELSQLLPSFTLAKFLFNNITIMAVSYAASVMTIAGAFFLASQIPGHMLHRKAPATTTFDASSESILMENSSQNCTPTRVTTTNTNATQLQTTAIILEKRNETNTRSACAALNVEVELMKLERQYRDEALLEDVRKRNNEITGNFRLNLPKIPFEGLRKDAAEGIDMERNWLSFKNDYSNELEKRDFLIGGTTTVDIKFPYFDDFDDYWTTFNNSTRSFFLWQLFANAAQQSYVRLPLMWFKFI